MRERSREKSPEELLHADSYTPEELSELTGIGIDIVRRAAYDGEMAAMIVDADIVEIPRSSAIAWLNTRSDTIADETYS